MTAGLAGAAAGAISAVVVMQSRPGPTVDTVPKVTVDSELYKGVTSETRSKSIGEGGKWTRPVVIASPSLENLAVGLRKRLGCVEYGSEQGPTIELKRFKSHDSDIKFHWERIVGRKVVLLFDTVDQTIFFEQLALLQALQGFAVPDGSDKTSKWKTYVNQGSYSWGRASEIVVVMPWYRPCQMERTSRWSWKKDGTWTNADPEGKWVDVPNALYYTRLLCTPGSVPPLPGPSNSLDNMPLTPLWRPPVELLFVELHEEAPVKQCANDLGATLRMERFVPYFLDKFKGKRAYPGKNNMYVLFPDKGAYDRYEASVRQILSLDNDHIVYIQKTRVGEQITQVEKLFFDQGEKESFKPTDHILILDDFTNSGGTLFGAVNLVQKMTGGSEDVPDVSIYVSHLVATYDLKVVESLKKKLRSMGPKCRFFCTNSIPMTSDLLKGEPQCEVVDISDFIADMVQ